MDQQAVLEVFDSVGVFITDTHVINTSGLHSAVYVNKDALYLHPQKISLLCRAIAEQFKGGGVEVVVAPALGGIILSQWIAHHLSEITGREVLAVYAEKQDGLFVIRRGYDQVIAKRKVLVAEDILTTGGSAKKVVEITRALGGIVVGLGVLCNRGGITRKDVGVSKLFALLDIKLDTWDEAECARTGPCSQEIPINQEVGKGKELPKPKPV